MAILTFKYLRELQKSERDSSVLQKIDTGFYTACAKYFESSPAEGETTKPLMKSILETRERKIVTAALQSARGVGRPENLLPEEEEFFSKISDTLKTHRTLIENILSENKEKPEESLKDAVTEKISNAAASSKNVLKIRAILDIPSFVAEDMKSYGPITAGQIAELPKKAAEALLGAKMAERVE
ncbi:Uncharacterised protein [uncultured archaeon]|nr:Uncharacterised protein [uncultured archaeon]